MLSILPRNPIPRSRQEVIFNLALAWLTGARIYHLIMGACKLMLIPLYGIFVSLRFTV